MLIFKIRSYSARSDLKIRSARFSGNVAFGTGTGNYFRNLGTTPILKKKKRSRSEKAILGKTLGIPGHSRSNSRNGTRDLIYLKTLFSEQLSERLSELVGRQNFSPTSRSVFSFKRRLDGRSVPMAARSHGFKLAGRKKEVRVALMAQVSHSQ